MNCILLHQLFSILLKNYKRRHVLKTKLLLTTVIIFFLLINTAYYWEGKLGLLAFLAFMVLFCIYVAFFFALIFQLHYAYKEHYNKRIRLYTIGALLIVLFLTFFRPNGFIDFEKFGPKILLVAYYKGSGPCSSFLKLREDLTFKNTSVCFGMDEFTGVYHIYNDTIVFDSVSGQPKMKFKFALIEKIHDSGERPYALRMYEDHLDSFGLQLSVVENNLKIHAKARLPVRHYYPNSQ